jgi:hypothetical protein
LNVGCRKGSRHLPNLQGQTQADRGVGVEVGVISDPERNNKKAQHQLDAKPLFYLARPERFELPTPWFVVWVSGDSQCLNLFQKIT